MIAPRDNTRHQNLRMPVVRCNSYACVERGTLSKLINTPRLQLSRL